MAEDTIDSVSAAIAIDLNPTTVMRVGSTNSTTSIQNEVSSNSTSGQADSLAKSTMSTMSSTVAKTVQSATSTMFVPSATLQSTVTIATAVELLSGNCVNSTSQGDIAIRSKPFAEAAADESTTTITAAVTSMTINAEADAGADAKNIEVISDGQTMTVVVRQSAANRVCSIPELLEHILRNLGHRPKDLLEFRRVDRVWRDTIAGSYHLQVASFLRPAHRLDSIPPDPLSSMMLSGNRFKLPERPQLNIFIKKTTFNRTLRGFKFIKANGKFYRTVNFRAHRTYKSGVDFKTRFSRKELQGKCWIYFRVTEILDPEPEANSCLPPLVENMYLSQPPCCVLFSLSPRPGSNTFFKFPEGTTMGTMFKALESSGQKP